MHHRNSAASRSQSVRTIRSFSLSAAIESCESRRLMSAAVDSSQSGATHSGGCSCGCKGSLSTSDTQLAVQQARDVVPTLSETAFVKLNRARGVESFWTPMSKLPAERPKAIQSVHASAMAPFKIDLKSLRSKLRSAPMEFSSAAANPLTLNLPNPDGGFSRFSVWESPVMEASLAAKFKSIKTYSGQGLDDPSQVLRFDVTLQGLRATVLGGSGTYYIDPTFHRETSSFVAYYRKDSFINPDNVGYTCDTAPGDLSTIDPNADAQDPITPAANGSTARSGTQLRTYRLAMSTTGNYTAFQGGTVTLGLAAVTSVVNRLNSVYERDLSIRLTLVANNDQLIFTNAATDPFTSPSNPDTTNQQNQTLIDGTIGDANYDVGHVLHLGSNNGLAGGIGSVGQAGIKAQGYSSYQTPTTDPFTIDYVAHEIGHQFGGRHSFSNCGGGPGDAAGIAVEPGSGSTIMAYAGICGSGTDLQLNSDAMFHSINFDQILSFVDNAIPQVGTRTSTGNTAPTVTSGGNRTIPANTPYALTANASDVNGDTLTYSWEQRNGASGTAVNTTTATTGPMVRAFLPSNSPTRTVPNLSSLNSGTLVTGERLSTVARSMSFTVMVRDNRAGGGGVNTASMTLSVVNTGASFAVTSPNSAVSWGRGTDQTVTWNVAGTTANGINTANVRISLSTDGGLTYPTVLAETTPNDGSQLITIPAAASLTTQARIKVEAIANIYFDISNVNFSIIAPPPPTPTAPVLDASTDTGISNSDRITRRNNNSLGNGLTFTVGNTVPGNTVRVFRGATIVAEAIATDVTTTLSTTGVNTFPNGTNTFTATQLTPANVSSVASAAVEVLVDTIAPTATYGITPTARNAPIGVLPITFGEPVFNLTSSSFILVRDGVTQPTAPLTLGGSGSSFTLGDLTAITSVTGDYTISLFSIASDAAGNQGSGFIAFSNNVVNLLAPPAGGNQVTLRPDLAVPETLRIFVNNATATPTFTWTFTPGQTLRIDGSTGADIIRFEGSTNSYNANISLALAGATTGDDQLNVASGNFISTATPVAPAGGGPRVSVFSGARVTFAANQTVRSLDLQGNAVATLGGDVVLESTPTLANNGAALGTRTYSAFLDMQDKSLIVRNGDLAALRDMTRHWLTSAAGLPGSTGLGSSLAFYQPTTAFNTIGVFSNSGYPGSPTKTTFAGSAVTATDVLLRYTRIGDTDLDGTVDAGDLSRLLQGMQGTGSTLAGGGTGWNFGDFDYDGDTDFADLGRLIASLRDQTPN